MGTQKIAGAIFNKKISSWSRQRAMQQSKFVHFFTALLAGLLLSGCSMDTSIKDISTYGLNDFEKSEVIVSGMGRADGTTLTYTIRLKNSNDSLVEGHVPTITKVSGTGSLGSCSRSDVNGLSFCTISSTTVGTVRIGVTNVKITLQRNIGFAPPEVTVGQIISGAIGTVTVSGYKITSSMGAEFSNTRYESGSGYKVYSTVQGDIASRAE